jgi:hypothetical protein
LTIKRTWTHAPLMMDCIFCIFNCFTLLYTVKCFTLLYTVKCWTMFYNSTLYYFNVKNFSCDFIILRSVFTIRVYTVLSVSCQKCVFDNLAVDAQLIDHECNICATRSIKIKIISFSFLMMLTHTWWCWHTWYPAYY